MWCFDGNNHILKLCNVIFVKLTDFYWLRFPYLFRLMLCLININKRTDKFLVWCIILVWHYKFTYKVHSRYLVRLNLIVDNLLQSNLKKKRFLQKNHPPPFNWLHSWIKVANWSIVPKFKLFVGFLNWNYCTNFFRN